MKFTKESLLDTLKAKLTANGKHLAISERTLKAQVETLYAIGVNEETELDAFVAQILPSFETLRGNYEKDNSDFVNQWKKDHPSPEPPKPTEPKTSDDKLDALMAEIKALKDANEATKREKTILDKKNALIANLKEKGIKDEKWLNTYLANTSIEEGTDIEAKATSALEFYNLAHATVDPSTTPSTTTTTAQNKDEFGDIASIIKRQRHIEDAN